MICLGSFSQNTSDIHPGKKNYPGMLDEEFSSCCHLKNFHLDFSISFHFQKGNWIHGAWIYGFSPTGSTFLRRLLFGHFSSLMSSGCCWLQLNVFEPSNWSFLVQKKNAFKNAQSFPDYILTYNLTSCIYNIYHHRNDHISHPYRHF